MIKTARRRRRFVHACLYRCDERVHTCGLRLSLGAACKQSLMNAHQTVERAAVAGYNVRSRGILPCARQKKGEGDRTCCSVLNGDRLA